MVEKSKRIPRIIRYLYAERQFYMRHQGQVHFVSVSPLAQLGLFLAAVAFILWTIYSSTLVFFQQSSFNSLHGRFAEMQSRYEERLAEMQAAHERLSVKLILAQDHFDKVTEDLQERHEHLAAIMSMRDKMGTELDKRREELRKAREAARIRKGKKKRIKAQKTSRWGRRIFPKPEGASAHTLSSRPIDSTAVLMMPESGDRKSWFDLEQRLQDLRHVLSDTGRETTDSVLPRLYSIGLIQTAILDHLEEAVFQKISAYEEALQVGAVMDADLMLARFASKAEEEGAKGGPYRPLSSSAAGLPAANITLRKPRANMLEAPLANRIHSLVNTLDRLAALDDLFFNLPLSPPIDDYHITSGFGPRVDPFSKRWGEHDGIDLVGGSEERVRSVLPGVVTAAGKQLAYGKMVEIDHGRGIITRYGHLKKILVKVGSKVAFRQSLGIVGNTGRSTGEHLHYEIRIDGRAQDPSKFLEAGKYVFKNRD